ncbi:MAG: ribonuclease Z [Bacteroidetes bacterium GWF2_41_9]|nr:MAG: ribonuclease Z [Bacteroidetes bacterium GWF2_41_9]HAM08808.1 ribonuclease Z [Bacteroidales bacterium]
MKLTVLGSSSALPTSERFSSAHVLNAHERLFLIDCGEGTQIQLRKNRIRFSRINHVFISHLHGDHIFGLYGLLSTLSLMGRKSPLRLYAPESYDSILLTHLKDFDIHLSYEIDFVPLKSKDPLIILDEKYLTVTSFPLKHRVQSFGFLFREKNRERNIIKGIIEELGIPVERIPAIKRGEDFLTPEGLVIKNDDLTMPPDKPLSYAYCSDTKYFPRLASFVKDVTMLYHESTFDKSKEDLAAMTFHSTTIDAARTALKANAGTLIIGHFSSRYKKIGPLVEEARTVFHRTFPAVDGRSYEITNAIIDY